MKAVAKTAVLALGILTGAAIGGPLMAAGDGHDHAKGAQPSSSMKAGSMGGGMMMHDMGGMMGDMKTMMEHMSGMMGGEGMMDQKHMQEMSKIMGEMSKTMQEMSQHMAKGEMDAAAQKRIKERNKSTNERLNRLGKIR